jgi:hypothetical protein
LGHLEDNAGQLAEARDHYRAAVELYEQTVGPSHPQTAFSRNSLGSIEVSLGNYETALPLLEESVAALRSGTPGSHVLAAALTNLSTWHEHRGAFEAALPLAEEAALLRASTGTPTDRFIAQYNLAVLYTKLERLDEAAAQFEAAAGIAESNAHQAFAKLGLAEIVFQRGDTADALDKYREAFALLETAVGPEHPQLIGPLGMLGLLEKTRNGPRSAAPFLDRAVDLAHRTGTAHDPRWLELHLDHAEVALALGDRAAAKTSVTRANEVLEAAGDEADAELRERARKLDAAVDR